MITEHAIRRLAESLGANLVGFADVSCLPSQVTDGLTHAISIGVVLAPTVIREMESGPTIRYFAECKRANALLDQLSGQVATAVESGGYKAREFAKQNGIQATICGVCIHACPWTQRYLASA